MQQTPPPPQLEPPAAQALALLRGQCEPAGFDLLQPFAIGSYNRVVEGSLRLEDFGSEAHLGVLVGNSAALWPRLRAALARDPALAAADDPLDTYCEQVLGRASAALGAPLSLRFAHESGPRAVAMQRLAHVAGLAFLTETHQSVHPVYGPWIGLRAAISLALPGPQRPAEQPEQRLAPALSHPCGGCAGRCAPAFERAVATLQGAPDRANLQAHWQEWLAWRDACPVGRAHRYTDAQIRYHYLQDRAMLR